CDLRYLLRLVLMVGNTVVLFGDTDLRIRSLAEFPGHHERKNTRHICLISRCNQIEHESHMFIKRIRDTDWSIQGGGTCTAASLRLLDAALDFADVFQIVADTCPIPRAEPTLKTGSLFRDRVENTPLHLNPLQAFAGRACFAEESLESKARIGFHRQWSG